MALKPILKLKVDELFLRWLSDPDTQHLLRTNLRQIQQGEPLVYQPQPGTHRQPGQAGSSGRAEGRRPGSPSTPPCSPTPSKVPTSPRSPRVRSEGWRTKSIKAAAAVGAGAQLEVVPVEGAAARLRADILRRGEADGRHVTILPASTAVATRTSPVTTTTTATAAPTGATPTTHQANQKPQPEKEAAALLQNHVENKDSSSISQSRPTTPAPSAADDTVEENRFLNQKKAQLQAKKDGNKLSNKSSPQQQQQQQQQPQDTNAAAATTNALNRSSNNSANDNNSNRVDQHHGQQAVVSSSTSVRGHSKRGGSAGSERDSTSSRTSSSSKSRPVPAARAGSTAHIPQFYFPHGRPSHEHEESDIVHRTIKEVFGKFELQRATKANMLALVKAVGLPSYWKSCLFIYAGGEKNGYVSLQSFLAAWRKLTTQCHDASSRFVWMCAKRGCQFMEEDDFIPLVQDVVEHHPGLSFLHEAPEFHSRYVQTVISRIFYCVNRSWSGRITATEIRRSNLLQTIRVLETEEDINQINDFFSYEHFYVIYCKFWELDKDHDLYISADDLLKHNDEAISSRMIERIFSGAVTKNLKDEKMSYKDFVWFLISEEDKRHPTSIEYWFRCMDVDGDGVISMYEMQYFYEEQVKKMESIGIDTLPFEDCLCMMLDMIAPANPDFVTLSDLKACKLTPIFFDTFFNLDKYLEHEQKDPFANIRDHDSDEPEPTDWERFAADEYDNLVTEEGTTDLQEEILYEDDFEPDEEPHLTEAGAAAAAAAAPEDPPSKARPGEKDEDDDTDDIYDFSHSKEAF